MQTYCDTKEREAFLEENIKHLELVNKRLAKLTKLREELIENIIVAFGHKHEGQCTYEYDKWKIEVKTPYVYSLNKKLYAEKQSLIPSEYNPVRQSISYSLDKRLCEEYIQYAPSDVRDVLVEMIEKKPGKANVTIKERI